MRFNNHKYTYVMEEERIKKQTYLRMAIMDSGYNAEEFINFMSTKRYDGGNIDNWSIEELKQIVQEFVSKEEIKDESGTGSTSPLEFNTGVPIYRRRFPSTVNTLGKDVTELADSPVRAKIESAKVVNKGLFSEGELCFAVSVKEKEWSVERLFQDFRSLRVQLERINPGYIVPPVHDFTADKEMRADLIDDTKEMLQNFLDGVLAHPLFGSSELVYCFLCGKQDNKAADMFPKRLKFYKDIPQRKHVKEMHREDGIGTVSTTKETDTYIKTLRKTSTRLKELYFDCMRLNRSMVVQLNSLSRTMNKQSEVYKEIAFHYELLKKPDIASTFDTMRMVFSTMNECYVQVQRSVCEIVKPMNNQLYYEFLSLEKKLNGLGRLHEKLIDKESKLIEKKTLLFKQREVEKWELSPNCTVPIEIITSDYNQALKEILPEETNDCARMRMLFGFFSNEIVEDFGRVCNRDNDKLCLCVMFGSKVFRDTAKLACGTWNELSEKYAKYSALIT
eukprot:TRINITY_DN5423_c0_g2_i11.p1 TRINITY_DN5423_c0_g2~~TRINITY_DN5423_c0_g2_i11.p1  ORF type:complete len:505 (-),score=152.73 TRINITY_DN5423_c0_g2_i11:66-1580(-)